MIWILIWKFSIEIESFEQTYEDLNLNFTIHFVICNTIQKDDMIEFKDTQ